MSKNIIIYDSCETEEELAKKLNSIADMIRNGHYSGFNPSWEIVEED